MKENEMFEGYPESMIDRFWNWYETHHAIYETFRQKACKVKQMGYKKYSARTIIESIRWDYSSKQLSLFDKEDGFKINDCYTPMMVRKLVKEDPAFSGFFETRIVRSHGYKSDEQRKREAA